MCKIIVSLRQFDIFIEILQVNMKFGSDEGLVQEVVSILDIWQNNNSNYKFQHLRHLRNMIRVFRVFIGRMWLLSHTRGVIILNFLYISHILALH